MQVISMEVVKDTAHQQISANTSLVNFGWCTKNVITPFPTIYPFHTNKQYTTVLCEILNNGLRMAKFLNMEIMNKVPMPMVKEYVEKAVPIPSEMQVRCPVFVMMIKYGVVIKPKTASVKAL